MARLAESEQVRPQASESDAGRGDDKASGTASLSRTTSSLLSQGDDAFQAKEFDKAIQLYTEAISLTAGEPNKVIFGNRSLAYSKLNRWQEALSDAEECVRLDASWPKAHFRLGSALLALERWSEAAEAFRKCDEVETDPFAKIMSRTMQHTVVATLEASAKATNDPDKAKLAAELKLKLPANITSEADPMREIKEVVQSDVAGLGAIPVTLLSGFLGTGKTTLLQHILSNNEGLRVAVIVNDMSEVNVDAQLILSGNQDPSNPTHGQKQVPPRMIEMTNGCICCNLREDLLVEVARLCKEKTEDNKRRFEYIVIESTGISEPLPVAQTFAFEDIKTGLSLQSIARLDTLVTMVDASSFWDEYTSADSLQDRKMGLNKDDNRCIIDILVDQLEVADVIVLNKCDLVSNVAILERTESAIQHLNPTAKIIRATKAKVDLGDVLNTGRFDMERTSQAAGWVQELMGNHVPETELYNIRSFVYRSRKPFHPDRLWPVISQGLLKNILRSKGHFWICSDQRFVLRWSTAGSKFDCQVGGLWVAAVEDDEEREASKRQLLENSTEERREAIWDERFGDRRVELVFIGMDMDEEAVRKVLDAALLTDEEMAEQPKWAQYKNPMAFFLTGARAAYRQQQLDKEREREEQDNLLKAKSKKKGGKKNRAANST